VIDYVLQHPAVLGPTRAFQMWNLDPTWEDNNYWAQYPAYEDTATETVFNVLSKNKYNIHSPGYVSKDCTNSDIMRLIPSPMYVPSEPTEHNNKYQPYALQVAQNGSDYYKFMRTQFYEEPETEDEAHDLEVNSIEPSNKRSRTSPSYSQDSKSARLEEWLLDSGATIHVTPNSNLLLNMYPCNRLVSVADGKQVQVRHAGDVLLKVICGSYLYLKGVLYLPRFQKNIISAPLLVKKQDYY